MRQWHEMQRHQQRGKRSSSDRDEYVPKKLLSKQIKGKEKKTSLRKTVVLTRRLNGLCLFAFSFHVHAPQSGPERRILPEKWGRFWEGGGGGFFCICFISNVSILAVEFTWSTLLRDKAQHIKPWGSSHHVYLLITTCLIDFVSA